MFGPLEKHVSLPNAVEKCKGTLLFGQISNLLSGLGCALNGLSQRKRENRGWGTDVPGRSAALKQHKTCTADAFPRCCCWTMRGTYIRAVLGRWQFSANCAGLTTVTHKGSIYVVFQRKIEFPEGNLWLGKCNLNFEGRIGCDILLFHYPPNLPALFLSKNVSLSQRRDTSVLNWIINIFQKEWRNSYKFN